MAYFISDWRSDVRPQEGHGPPGLCSHPECTRRRRPCLACRRTAGARHALAGAGNCQSRPEGEVRQGLAKTLAEPMTGGDIPCPAVPRASLPPPAALQAAQERDEV